MPGAVRLDRAISIGAPPAIVFAWLCQLRIAPYSYDLLDNTGRRSPRTRSDELTDLAVGQRFVRIFGRTYVFELASFARDEHLTLRPRKGSAMSRFGSVCNTYAVRPEGGGTRLHVRVLFDGTWLLGQTLALVNLLMMRQQLLVLKSLAEHEALTAI
jgi:polyketide cyclase/dehydrase/lipid transport protein